MTIEFILNGEDVVISAEANVRLIDILRERFGLLGAKSGCAAGKCGVCSIMFKERPTDTFFKAGPACLIPAFRLRGIEIMTIEGFSQTDEYQDIITGFTQANMETCGYCRAGKILAAEALLEQKERLSRKEILAGFNGVKCRCTDPEELAQALTIIADIRQRRLYGSPD